MIWLVRRRQRAALLVALGSVAAKYWPFQAAEAAILLAVVAALLGVGVGVESLRRIG